MIASPEKGNLKHKKAVLWSLFEFLRTQKKAVYKEINLFTLPAKSRVV